MLFRSQMQKVHGTTGIKNSFPSTAYQLLSSDLLQSKQRYTPANRRVDSLKRNQAKILRSRWSDIVGQAGHVPDFQPKTIEPNWEFQSLPMSCLASFSVWNVWKRSLARWKQLQVFNRIDKRSSVSTAALEITDWLETTHNCSLQTCCLFHEI